MGRNLQIGFTQTPHTCTGLGGTFSSSAAYAGKLGQAIRVLSRLEAVSDRWAQQAPHQACQMLRRKSPLLRLLRMRAASAVQGFPTWGRVQMLRRGSLLLPLYRAFPTWAIFRCSGKAGPSSSSSGDGACLCCIEHRHLGLSQMLRQGSPLLRLLRMRAASAAQSCLTWGQVQVLRRSSLRFWLLRVGVCPGSVLPHPPNAVLYGALRNACQDRLPAAVPGRAGRLSAAMNQSMNVTGLL